jgi:hypothetical protein
MLRYRGMDTFTPTPQSIINPIQMYYSNLYNYQIYDPLVMNWLAGVFDQDDKTVFKVDDLTMEYVKEIVRNYNYIQKAHVELFERAREILDKPPINSYIPTNFIEMSQVPVDSRKEFIEFMQLIKKMIQDLTRQAGMAASMVIEYIPEPARSEVRQYYEDIKSGRASLVPLGLYSKTPLNLELENIFRSYDDERRKQQYGGVDEVKTLSNVKDELEKFKVNMDELKRMSEPDFWNISAFLANTGNNASKILSTQESELLTDNTNAHVNLKLDTFDGYNMIDIVEMIREKIATLKEFAPVAPTLTTHDLKPMIQKIIAMYEDIRNNSDKPDITGELKKFVEYNYSDIPRADFDLIVSKGNVDLESKNIITTNASVKKIRGELKETEKNKKILDNIVGDPATIEGFAKIFGLIIKKGIVPDGKITASQSVLLLMKENEIEKNKCYEDNEARMKIIDDFKKLFFKTKKAISTAKEYTKSVYAKFVATINNVNPENFDNFINNKNDLLETHIKALDGAIDKSKNLPYENASLKEYITSVNGIMKKINTCKLHVASVLDNKKITDNFEHIDIFVFNNNEKLFNRILLDLSNNKSNAVGTKTDTKRQSVIKTPIQKKSNKVGDQTKLAIAPKTDVDIIKDILQEKNLEMQAQITEYTEQIKTLLMSIDNLELIIKPIDDNNLIMTELKKMESIFDTIQKQNIESIKSMYNFPETLDKTLVKTGGSGSREIKTFNGMKKELSNTTYQNVLHKIFDKIDQMDKIKIAQDLKIKQYERYKHMAESIILSTYTILTNSMRCSKPGDLSCGIMMLKYVKLTDLNAFINTIKLKTIPKQLEGIVHRANKFINRINVLYDGPNKDDIIFNIKVDNKSFVPLMIASVMMRMTFAQ